MTNMGICNNKYNNRGMKGTNREGNELMVTADHFARSMYKTLSKIPNLRVITSDQLIFFQFFGF